MRPVERVWRQTLAAFEWLAEGIDAETPVSLLTNPGNVGDALINLSCHRWLRRRFVTVKVPLREGAFETEHIFVAGGGNLVEPLYSALATMIGCLGDGHRLYLFPSTISGNVALLRSLAGRARVLCRERVSFDHVASNLPVTDVQLCHDAAFALADRFEMAFADLIAEHPSTEARFFRTDLEQQFGEEGDGDLMGQVSGDWTDIAAAERAVLFAATQILQYGRVRTDRLHCAILAAMLNRYVVLRPNSYFKNRAVFEYSLAHFPNVRFEAELLITPAAT